MLSGDLARYLFAAGRGLAPRPADASELVLTALEQALTLRQPAPGLIIHADRGSQYTSHACRQRIDDAGAIASYARPGNPYDNAQAEVR